jgi:hypothetical protein
LEGCGDCAQLLDPDAAHAKAAGDGREIPSLAVPTGRSSRSVWGGAGRRQGAETMRVGEKAVCISYTPTL